MSLYNSSNPLINNLEMFLQQKEKIHFSYKASVVQVNLAMLNIQMSTLPKLNYLPKNWETIKQRFEALKNSSMQWINQTLIKLSSVPLSIEEQNKIVEQNLMQAQQDYKELLANPADVKAKFSLGYSLSGISYCFETIMTLIKGVKTALKNFKESVKEMLIDIQALLEETKQSVHYDEEVIHTLEKDIQTLQNAINKANQDAIRSGVVAAESAVTGGVLCAYGGLAGSVISTVFFGVSLFFSGKALTKTLEAVSKKKIVKLKETQASTYTQDIAELTLFKSQLSNILDATQGTEDNLDYIYSKWQNLQVAIVYLTNSINKALSDLQQEQLHALGNDLKEFDYYFKNVQRSVQRLKIEVFISNATLSLGMSVNELERKIEDSSLILNLEYFHLKSA